MILVLLIAILMPAVASGLECPSMPQQTQKDLEVEVRAAVGKIGPARGAELETKTKAVTRDLMGKLPQADKVYLQQMMFAAYCSALRDDKSISETEKGKRIKAYNDQVLKTLYGQQGKPQASGDPEKTVREHLQVARNYEIDRNKAKTLEYALKAYQADKSSPEATNYLAYAYLFQNNRESFVKAREVLVANSHRLDVSGKATLGVAEYKLDKINVAFSILKELNFIDCNEEILPYAVIALTGSAFEMMPHEEALHKMKDGLVALDRRMGLYEPRASVGGSKANLTGNFQRWYGLRMAKFYVGGLWLAKAINKKAIQEMTAAIAMASEGLVVIFGLIPKENIVRHFALINDLTQNDSELIKRNRSFILRTLDEYKKTTDGYKENYAVESIKLDLLKNCLLDLYSSPEQKRPVQLMQPIEFIVESLVTSDTNVRRITFLRNFAIKEPIRVLEDKLPAKTANVKHTIKLAKDDFFDRLRTFTFELSVQDVSGNEVSKKFCPNFFANQVNN
jgi:hypothetical protein